MASLPPNGQDGGSGTACKETGMTRKMIGGQLVAGMILLGLVAAMESFTDWDMALQRLWFDSDTHEIGRAHV